MIIHFGVHLDGMQPAAPRTAVGEIALGPARLLAVLESQLGLPPAEARPGEALLAYRACLEELDDDERFYHRSLATDAIGAARTLLGWRARWHEAGWRGSFEGPASPRLADMADVERLARERVPLDAGQRLHRILAALDAGLVTEIEGIVLHDEPASLPAEWRAVLERFSVEIAADVSPVAHAAPDTDLHRIQRLLLSIEAPAARCAGDEPLELAGDESFVILRAVSRDLSAQTVAEYLRRLDAADETVLIAERDGIIVDNALERAGLPRAGFQHYSRFRAVTQVLKLCLGLVWEPVSPQGVLQFLLHPIGPLPSYARSALAEAVAGEPGIGGRAWRAKLGEITLRLRQRAESESRPELAAQAAALEADIRYWLESERFAPAQGAPPVALIERAQRCTTWLAARLNAGLPERKERDLYAAALAQGEALIGLLAGLAERGETTIDRITLERLLDEVTSGAADPGTFAQAGHVRATTQPGAITRPWETVIWWDLCEQTGHAAHPWSEAEVAELRTQGVALPSPAERIHAESRAWRRAILCARSRAILVVHERDEGRHPLLIQIESLARGFNEVRLEDTLLAPLGGRNEISGLDIRLEPLAPRPLPALRRWWRLPAGCKLRPREQESYSSLQKLLYHPHEWVLGYAARLRRGRAANLSRGNLLYGNLAHRLFETYFETHANRASRKLIDLGPWIAVVLPALIRREAALLTEPGMGVAREAVMTTLEHALVQLLRHLDGAGIEHVAAEAAHAVPFRTLPFEGAQHEVTLCGAIDLLLVDGAGREIVVDVKWGNEERRGEDLARNRALQLATYAYLRHVEDGEPLERPHAADEGHDTAGRNLELALERPGRWPEQAYFIVTTGNMLARDARVFPDAIVYPPDFDESTERFWARVALSIDWRWAQIASGNVEVNAAGTEPDAESLLPEDALAVLAAPDKFDEFTWLTGWAEGV